MEDGLDILIAQLQSLKGAAFWQQLVAITKRKEFKEIEPGMERLQDAARKARSFGYQVYILPNPKGFRSADYIFKYKNSYKLYELKTIHGRNSVGNRLSEASKQSNRVLFKRIKKHKKFLYFINEESFL